MVFWDYNMTPYQTPNRYANSQRGDNYWLYPDAHTCKNNNLEYSLPNRYSIDKIINDICLLIGHWLLTYVFFESHSHTHTHTFIVQCLQLQTLSNVAVFFDVSDWIELNIKEINGIERKNKRKEERKREKWMKDRKILWSKLKRERNNLKERNLKKREKEKK